MKKNFFLALFFIFLCAFSANAKKPVPPKKEKATYQVCAIAFYNQENLFDTIDDPLTRDEEYTPNGGNHWTGLKYRHKVHNMAFALSKLGFDEDPRGAAIIGVCEVENREVLEDVCAQPEWGNRKMEIVHQNSPDRRGIDVGLLYDPTRFMVVNYAFHPFRMESQPNFRTRDQLVVSGYLKEMGEKIHIIVGHWPSRYGGEVRSRPNRAAAAELSKHIADSIYQREPNAKIIIMGDLNDDPFNIPCAEVLGAKKDRKDVVAKGFFNTMWQHLENGNGTLSYNGAWNLFDQIIISEPLLNADKNTSVSYWKSEIFNKDFLTVQEGKDKGTPLRTTKGGVWQDGYSDHFPTLIYLIKKKQ